MEIVSDYHCKTMHDISRDEYRNVYGRKYDTNIKLSPRKSLDDREYIGYAIDNILKRQRRKMRWKMR